MRDPEINTQFGFLLASDSIASSSPISAVYGRFINRIFPLDSLNLTKVATRQLPFHPVEELHIVAPSPAPASPLLAHEFSHVVSDLRTCYENYPWVPHYPRTYYSPPKTFPHIPDRSNIQRIDAQFYLDLAIRTWTGQFPEDFQPLFL